MTKAIIFDLDGTLVDTTDFILGAFEHTLKIHGIPPVARHEIAAHVGKPLVQTYELLAPDAPFDELFTTHDSFQYKNLHLIKEYPGVKKTLQTLAKRDIKLAVQTNRTTKQSVVTSLQEATINQYIDVVVCKNDVKQPKPHPEGATRILAQLGFKAQHALFVGDTAIDIETGRNAHIKTVGVTYGFGGSAVRRSDPDHIIDRFSDLLKLV